MGSTKGRGGIYFPGKDDDSDNGNKGKRRDERTESENTAKRICASILDAASSLVFAPHSTRATRSRGSTARGRRGALCVSENVTLIEGSVAVMRYQPTNKRINAKRRGGRREARVWRKREGEGATIGNEEEEECLHNQTREKPGESVARGSPIQCFD